MDVEVGILGLVLVVALTVLKQCHGVTQRIAIAQRGIQLVVVGEQRGEATGAAVNQLVILIGSHQRRLEQCQGRRRRNGAGKGGGHAVVIDRVVGACNRDVETRREVPQNRDVGIETYIHTVEGTLANGVLSLDITDRQVIHTDVVATLHVDAVVLCQGIAVDLVLPVRIIMIGVIIETCWVVVQELELQLLQLLESHLLLDGLLNGRRSQHLSSIDTIL